MLKNNYKNQYISATVANLINVSFGLASGWTSSSFLFLETDKSTVSTGPLSSEQLSWINALLSAGALLGTIVYALLIKSNLRKRLLVSLALPIILSWLIIIIASEVWHLYLARALAGISCGGSVFIVPIFVSEIAEKRLQGRLVLITILSTNVGYVLAFIAGYFDDYGTVPKLFLIAPIIYLVSIVYVKETPIQLLRMNELNDANQSMRFYWNTTGSRNHHLQHLMSLIEKEKSAKLQPLNFRNFYSVPSLQKSQVIALFLVGLQEMSGCYTMLSYTATIFEDCGSTISPNLSAIFVGIIQLVGACLSFFLVDHIRRKPLLIWSFICTSISLLCLGSYGLAFRHGYDVGPFSWFPVASFSSVLFFAALGTLTLPMIIIDELLPVQFKSTCISICLCLAWILSFVLTKSFGHIADQFGVHVWLFLFALCCIAGATFVGIYVPETYGSIPEELRPLLDQ